VIGDDRCIDEICVQETLHCRAAVDIEIFEALPPGKLHDFA